MSSRFTKCGLFVAAAFVLIGIASQANAGFVQKDSADFTWKYEMDETPAGQDLDANGATDFAPWTLNGGSASVSSGVLSMDSSGNKFYALLGPARIWANSGVSFATGYTIETRVKVDSSTGALGALMIDAAPSDNKQAVGQLTIAGAGQFWGMPADQGTEPVGQSLGTQNNTDDFHTFRIAQTPSAGNLFASVYSVWRDGVLLSAELPTAYWANASTLFDFGAPSGVIHGTSQVDYFRFTPGAYAPIGSVPEPGTLTLLGLGLLGFVAYAWRKRK
jgi:hypothetical protein